MEHFGMDLHSKTSEIVGFSAGSMILQKSIRTTERHLRQVFGRRPSGRTLLECGCQSTWAYRILRDLGHDVVVVNPRRIRLIAESTLKCDRIDAEILAQLAGLDRTIPRSL